MKFRRALDAAAVHGQPGQREQFTALWSDQQPVIVLQFAAQLADGRELIGGIEK